MPPSYTGPAGKGGPIVPKVVRVDEIAAVTGEGSANRTGSRFGVYGTDLGILWDNGQGEILVAFGDSYGSGWTSPGAGPDHADWRCNVLAVSTTARATPAVFTVRPS